jgi:ergothioneine biosynthesis protein EgtB
MTAPALLQLFVESQAALEATAAPLSVEDFVVQAMEDASPVKWHLAHVAWFFETFVLAAASTGYQAFDPRYRFLFNSYYEAVGDRHPRPDRGLLSRPTVEEVRRYRRHVGEAMVRLLEGPALPPAPAFAVELGVNHAEQHQELIATDVKVVLARNPLRPVYLPRPARAPAVPVELAWVSQEGGLLEVGHAGDAFAFDNERPRHRTFLEPFQIANRLITNAEYLEFMEAGGYEQPTLWLSDGWAARQRLGWEAPMYWERAEGGGWEVASLHGSGKVEPLEPVCHVSFYEADAYARWKGVRLPLEQEWEAAVARQGPPRAGRWSPHPEPLAGSPAAGEIAQAFGAAWQWTQSPYVPYPGFRSFDGAFGEYNGKFMSNQLVLRGSSCVTPPRHARVTYRNFFRPDARWQFTGIRLARDAR